MNFNDWAVQTQAFGSSASGTFANQLPAYVSNLHKLKGTRSPARSDLPDFFGAGVGSIGKDLLRRIERCMASMGQEKECARFCVIDHVGLPHVCGRLLLRPLHWGILLIPQLFLSLSFPANHSVAHSPHCSCHCSSLFFRKIQS